jgi:hypothetical protein
VYVDDLLITGMTPEEIGRFKREMQLQFKMADLGLLSLYLGLEIQQGDGGIGLCQAHYTMKILQTARMGDCNSSQTPMEERLKLSRDSEAEEEDATLYCKLIGSLRYLVNTQPDLIFAVGYLSRLIGSLRYLVNTRPDLIFTVGYLSRFMQRPTAEHMAALKSVALRRRHY